MNITITEFATPFSFFCRPNDGTLDPEVLKENPDAFLHFKNVVNNVTHGQYVAVFWKNKWLRGVVSMENDMTVWLVDYGLHLRVTEKTVVLDLPAEYKKYPTKVFEASIHGVVPMDKEISDDCSNIINKVSLNWTPGSIEKAQTLLQAASKTYFVPIAIISTKLNDVVIGDLYLKLPEQGLCNLADELEMWPVFLAKNGKSYIENLPLHYTTRRKHRASPLKPDISNYELPTITVDTSFPDYNTICENSAQAHPAIEDSSDSEDGSTAINAHRGLNRDAFRLTPEEMEKYASMHVKIFDQVYNALHLLLNKIKDLNLCERYKDYDLKSVGRGYVRNRKSLTYIDSDDL